MTSNLTALVNYTSTLTAIDDYVSRLQPLMSMFLVSIKLEGKRPTASYTRKPSVQEHSHLTKVQVI